jgi:hypothetical protein
MEGNKRNPMFSGKEPGKELSPEHARRNAGRFNENRKEGDIKAHYFSEKLIRKILRREGVIGLRVYYAANDENQIEAFLVGVNHDGDNVFSEKISMHGEKDMAVTRSSGIYASAAPCPDMCPKKPDNGF